MNLKRKIQVASKTNTSSEDLSSNAVENADLTLVTPVLTSRATKKHAGPKSGGRAPPIDIGIDQRLLLGAGPMPLADAALVSNSTSVFTAMGLTAESLKQACDFLARVDERLVPLIEQHGLPERLLAKGPGNSFATLSKGICFQQLATQAAAKIFERVLESCHCSAAGILDPSSVLATTADDLRAAGLSRAKAAYVHDLARHFHEGLLSDAAIHAMDPATLHTSLTAVKGLGPWSVDMFALFHLGLPDVLPVGDLGVRRGMQVLYGMKALPTPKQMEAVAEKWRPWRSVGSYYMWKVEVSRVTRKK